ncbi:MAG: phosphoribosylamine--glycine ligase [Treponema sp.]|nr:phosphoribosylamine--glycine ligase [Treponema sp.]
MKVIVVGSGGREHAISYTLAQSASVDEVICIPGNGGTAFEKKCRNVDVKGSLSDTVTTVAKETGAAFAVIGPEDPLAEGIADVLWQAGIPTVGPKSKGAALEASKDLSKQFMAKYGVACAYSSTFTDMGAALAYVEEKGAPIVIKADGLAAGKGVVVAKTLDEAKDAVRELMDGKVGEAGKKLVIEEYLQGVEISVLSAVSVTPESAKSGKATIVPFLPARDHKRLLDGAQGPNTGGMGAVCPLSDVSDETMQLFRERILEPTLKGMISENMDYRGFIFFGLMLTKDGPKCLEYNVRLGDPETQAVLPMMDFDFAALCQAIIDADGKGALADFPLCWKSGFQVAPVAVSGGYPGSYVKGKAITVDSEAMAKTGAKLFVAGAVNDRRANSGAASGAMVTSGGRVLACSAHGATFDEAWTKAYEALKTVHFDGMQYRKDIGLPGAAESN